MLFPYSSTPEIETSHRLEIINAVVIPISIMPEDDRWPLILLHPLVAIPSGIGGIVLFTSHAIGKNGPRISLRDKNVISKPIPEAMRLIIKGNTKFSTLIGEKM